MQIRKLFRRRKPWETSRLSVIIDKLNDLFPKIRWRKMKWKLYRAVVPENKFRTTYWIHWARSINNSRSPIMPSKDRDYISHAIVTEVLPWMKNARQTERLKTQRSTLVSLYEEGIVVCPTLSFAQKVDALSIIGRKLTEEGVKSALIADERAKQFRQQYRQRHLAKNTEPELELPHTLIKATRPMGAVQNVPTKGD